MRGVARSAGPSIRHVRRKKKAPRLTPLHCCWGSHEPYPVWVDWCTRRIRGPSDDGRGPTPTATGRAPRPSCAPCRRDRNDPGRHMAGPRVGGDSRAVVVGRWRWVALAFLPSSCSLLDGGPRRDRTLGPGQDRCCWALRLGLCPAPRHVDPVHGALALVVSRVAVVNGHRLEERKKRRERERERSGSPPWGRAGHGRSGCAARGAGPRVR